MGQWCHVEQNSFLDFRMAESNFESSKSGAGAPTTKRGTTDDSVSLPVVFEGVRTHSAIESDDVPPARATAARARNTSA